MNKIIESLKLQIKSLEEDIDRKNELLKEMKIKLCKEFAEDNSQEKAE